jgi:hypothetical protein
MKTTRLLIFSVTILLTLFGAAAMSGETPQQYIQIAEIDVDQPQLDSYKVAVTYQDAVLPATHARVRKRGRADQRRGAKWV